MDVNGYLIKNQGGKYLSQSLFWFGHGQFADAWVHPEDKLEGILTQSEDWDYKPTDLQRAVYDPDINLTSLISGPIDIRGLDVEQVKGLLKNN